MRLGQLQSMDVSLHVIRRLPRYLRELDDLMSEGVRHISSIELGRRMGFTPSQIRQDFSYCGAFGVQGYGYSIPPLREGVAKMLGMDRDYSAVLIGAGKLGRVLLEHFSEVAKGYHLRAVFDSDCALIGSKIGGHAVRSVSGLGAFVEKNKIDIAILAVPKEQAQPVADALTESGIRAIWNFTNTEIETGEKEIPVEDVHFSDSFLTLSYFLAQADREKSPK